MSVDVHLAIAPFFHLERLHPPLGLAYLAAIAREQGFTCRTSDYRMELDARLDDTTRQLLDENGEIFFKPRLPLAVMDVVLPEVEDWAIDIAAESPRVLGISCFRSTRATSFALALAIKELSPETFIVFGGPDATLNSEEILRCSAVDAVVVGDGEESFAAILDAILRGRGSLDAIPNLALRDSVGGIRTTPRRPLAPVASLPFPDFRGFDLDPYWRTRPGKPPMLPIVAARGCSANCTFCDERTFWPTVNYRTPQSVVDEMIIQASRHGVSMFEFYDLSLNSRISVLSELCDLLIANGSRYQWFGMARFGRGLTDDLIDRLHRAGCVHLSFGLESGSHDVLKHMRKYSDVADTSRILRSMHAAGIETHCMVIVGYPTETEEDFLATLHFLEENQRYITSVNLGSTCSIKPGTPLWQMKERMGIRFDERGAWEFGDNTNELRMERLDRLKEAVSRFTFRRSEKYDVLNEYKKEKMLRPRRSTC